MTKRTFSMIAASLVVATGLFWARMLTSPPVAERTTASMLPRSWCRKACHPSTILIRGTPGCSTL